MVLYSTEARESWKSLSAKMREKIAVIPGDVLSYNDAGAIGRILSMFDEYVDMEEKAASAARTMERERPRIIVEVEGGMVRSVHADREVDVDVLDYDNYYASADGSEEETFCEDLMCENGLLQKVW